MVESLFQTIISAFLTGTSCSVCGASSSNAFLSVYVLTHRRLLAPVWLYFLGKLISTTTLCVATAMAGDVIMSVTGQVGEIDLYLLGQYLILVVTLFLIARWFWTRFRKDRHRGETGTECGLCENCHASVNSAARRTDKLALFLNGMVCGVVPCGPLILLLGLCVGQTAIAAWVAGAVFSAVGFLSPVLIWLVISRLLANKLEKDVQRYIPLLRLECYFLLLGITIYSIIIH